MRMIRRSAHVRRLRGKSIVVKSSMIRNLGLPGKGPQIIPVRSSGALTRFGYRVKNPTSSRRAALSRILNSGRNPLTLFHQLNAVAKLTSRTKPKLSRRYSANSRWVLKYNP